jgi:hypothetical protein
VRCPGALFELELTKLDFECTRAILLCLQLNKQFPGLML